MNFRPFAKQLLFCAAVILPVLFTACTPTLTRTFKTGEPPIYGASYSRPVDDENLEFIVKFRNMSDRIVSFDYTLSDVPGVPHIDASGPNSGLIENLYPGAEVEVKNPWKTTAIQFVPGKALYGKSDAEQLKKVFNVTPKSGSAAEAAMVIPEL